MSSTKSITQPASVRKKRFIKEDEEYFKFIDRICESNISSKDLIYQFPLYVGKVNLARFITFYEVYCKVVNISGAIADIGTWKGYSLLTLAKLSMLLEPHSNTDIYGFDWFKGTEVVDPTDEVRTVYVGDKNKLQKLIDDQGIGDRIIINDLDLKSVDLDDYFRSNQWLRFKLIFMDCGTETVLKNALPKFWDRLSPGGIMMLDHYNHSSSPYESIVVQNIIENRVVHQLPFSRSPTSFIIK